jgi:hypothetical protein
VEQLVAQINHSAQGATVSKLLDLACDSCEDLEDACKALSVLEFVSSSQTFLHLLLHHRDGFGGEFGWGGTLLLEERGSFHFRLEKSSHFSDDGCGLLMLSNQGFELIVSFGSSSIEFIDLSLVVLDFLGLRSDDSLHYGSSGVKVSLEFSFELDSLGVAFGQILIVGSDVSVAGRLEIVVRSIGFLLFSNVSVFQIVKCGEKGVQGVTCLQLEVDRVEQSLSEGSGVDSVDKSDVIIFSCPDCGNNQQTQNGEFHY